MFWQASCSLSGGGAPFIRAPTCDACFCFWPSTFTANPAFIFCLCVNQFELVSNVSALSFLSLFFFKSKVIITCWIGYLCYSFQSWERVFYMCVLWLGWMIVWVCEWLPLFMQYIKKKKTNLFFFGPICLCMCEQGNKIWKMCVRTLVCRSNCICVRLRVRAC